MMLRMAITLPTFIPSWDTLRRYAREDLRADLTAGMTVAIVALPQSMAYAVIAGVAPVYGLYGAIVAAIVGSMFGSSNHLVTGPTNAIALMVAAAMHRYLNTEGFYPTLFLLTFLVGGLQFAFGCLRLGKIVNFVSHSVIVGFTAGAGVIIGLGQLPELLGVTLPKGYMPLYRKVFVTLQSAGEANLYAVGIALATIAVVLACRRIHKSLPGPLIALIGCAILVRAIGLGEKGIKLVGDIPDGLPGFAAIIPNLSTAMDLFPSAVAIAVVGLVEAIAIAKSIALSTEQRVDANREFRGQGLANIAGSFFQCFPSSGSFTRSAVNHVGGGRTRLAGILSGLFVALALVFLAAQAKYIPNAALAGIIVLVAYGMVNRHAMARIAGASREELIVLLITAGATILMPDLERAILAGVLVSVIVHVWRTGEVRVRLLHRHGGTFVEGNLREAPGRTNIAVVHLDGALYFGSAGDFQEKLAELSRRVDPDVYVIRLKRIQVVDISAFEVLESFIEKALERKRHVLLCGVSPDLKRFLDKIGLTRRLGEENIFLAEETLYASTRKAYERAETLAEMPVSYQI